MPRLELVRRAGDCAGNQDFRAAGFPNFGAQKGYVNLWEKRIENNEVRLEIADCVRNFVGVLHVTPLVFQLVKCGRQVVDFPVIRRQQQNSASVHRASRDDCSIGAFGDIHK